MSIKSLIETIKKDGILRASGILEELYKLATENEAQLTAITTQLESVVAENAALKSGFKYFSYSEISGFEEHGTAELAMKSADADLAGERDEASSEGWSEETDTICWGVIAQKAVEGQFEKPSEENGWIGWSDFKLLPPIETPATDAFLAEVRASGVDAAIEVAKNIVAQEFQYKDFDTAQRVCSKFPESDLVGKVEMVEWLADFAAQLRQGGAV